MRDLSSALEVMEFPAVPKSVETESRGSYLPSFCYIKNKKMVICFNVKKKKTVIEEKKNEKKKAYLVSRSRFSTLSPRRQAETAKKASHQFERNLKGFDDVVNGEMEIG
jgi:PHD/YefM family antitoxin component YafN of YafNO toxin-antitoxin module